MPPAQGAASAANDVARAGRPEDVAAAVLFLASTTEFITGQVIPVDGGQSIP